MDASSRCETCSALRSRTRLPAKRVLPVFWRGGDGLCNTSSNFLRIGSQVGHLDRGKNLS